MNNTSHTNIGRSRLSIPLKALSAFLAAVMFFWPVAPVMGRNLPSGWNVVKGQVTVTVNGKVIGKDADFPENTGIIIEAPGFLPNYSGMKNLEYLASIRGKIGKEQIESAMKTVGLDPSSKLRVGKYSLGMKQRLGIAQAIMEDQQLLILDEPMNALDKDAVEEMRKLFLSFKASGKTMLIVSHNEGDISTLCDEVYEFDGARIKRRENV